VKGLEGVKVVEVGGVAAMPLAGMLMASWGADVIHVEPPGRGDLQRHLLPTGMGGWAKPHPVNYLWEHVGRGKRSIALNMGSSQGQAILHRLCASADLLLNNLRPYELKKFDLEFQTLSRLNPRLVYANLTGYGRQGPEGNTGGFDSVAFWARSGVMELMREPGGAPNISRPMYGDSITSLSLLAGVMAALFIRERTGLGQEVDVSLFNTAVWVLGADITGCLVSEEDAVRPTRQRMANPIRNIYPTRDNRWIMLGMTNAQHYWPGFCQAIERPDLEHDPRFATYDARAAHAEELVAIVEERFRARTYEEWKTVLTANKLVWSSVNTPLEVTRDEQALANDFFVATHHPDYGPIRLLNNPIKLSRTPAEQKRKAPSLGEHTDEILMEIAYTQEEIAGFKEIGVVQ
jgi:crotonobetainyl-CoA:carnitine CoA-transferase CaiB-like acyl-CoA transferase